MPPARLALRRSPQANEIEAPRGAWWESNDVRFIKCLDCGRSIAAQQIVPGGGVLQLVTCHHPHCTWAAFVQLVDDTTW